MGGSGIGASVAANKRNGIRAICRNTYSGMRRLVEVEALGMRMLKS
jgi:ribose 5-phosphate isomerase RpiB